MAPATARALSQGGRSEALGGVRLQEPAPGAGSTKIVLNMGLGEATQNPKLLEKAAEELAAITGQKPWSARRASRSRTSSCARARPSAHGDAARRAHVGVLRSAGERRAAARARLQGRARRRPSTGAATTRSASASRSSSRRSSYDKVEKITGHERDGVHDARGPTPRARRCSRTSACRSAADRRRRPMMTDPSPTCWRGSATPGRRGTRSSTCPSSTAQARGRAGAGRERLPRRRRASRRAKGKPVWCIGMRYDDDGQPADRRACAACRSPGRRVYVGHEEIPQRAQRARRRGALHVEGRSLRPRGARAARRRRTALRGLVEMSRIGRKPIAIPSGVTVEQRGRRGPREGAEGHARARRCRRAIERRRSQSGEVHVRVAPTSASRRARLHGLARALVANMVRGRDAGLRARARDPRRRLPRRGRRARS